MCVTQLSSHLHTDKINLQLRSCDADDDKPGLIPPSTHTHPQLFDKHASLSATHFSTLALTVGCVQNKGFANCFDL